MIETVTYSFLLSAKLDNLYPPFIPKKLQTSLDGVAWALPAGHSRILSVADEISEDESDTIRVKPKTLPPTPSEREAFVAVKKSLFKALVEKAVVESVSQSVTPTEDRLTEVATRVEGVAPSVPPVRSSQHKSTEAHSFTDRFRGLGVALEDFVP